MYEAKKLRDTTAKINPMQSSYQHPATSSFNQYTPNHGNNFTGAQSRFYNNYIGNGLIGGGGDAHRMNPSNRYAGHQTGPQTSTQIYPGATTTANPTTTLTNSYAKLANSGSYNQSTRYGAASQSYKRSYF